MSELPIVCDLTALSNQQRQWLIPEFKALFLTVAEVIALPKGFGFKFLDVDFDQFMHIAKLVALDRLCCSFIRHEIIQPAGSQDVWLYFTANTDIKGFIENDISQLVGQHAAIISMFKQLNINPQPVTNRNACLC